MKFIPSTNATLVSNAKTRKSVFTTSRFKDGQVLRIVGFTFVEDADDTSTEKRVFPVLQTTLNGQPFENIWLSTLCREIITADGEALTPNGTLNQLAQRIGDDANTTTDEIWLTQIVAQTANKDIIVVRKRNYKRMFRNGNIAPSVMLEFNIG